MLAHILNKHRIWNEIYSSGTQRCTIPFSKFCCGKKGLLENVHLFIIKNEVCSTNRVYSFRT